MSFIIVHKGIVLHGQQAEQAIKATSAHFSDAGVEPSEAAWAAFIQEGEQEEITDLHAAWAKVWRSAPKAVATALGVAEADIEVNLDLGR